MTRNLKVASFTAHPDDFEACALGTIMRYKERGHDIKVFIATDGRRGGEVQGQELAALRKQEALKALAYADIIPEFLEFEDGRLVYDKCTYDKISGIIENYQPDLVITHSPNDYHVDHRAISNMVTDASWCPVLYCDNFKGYGFEPEYFVDITKQFEIKIKALMEHKSQRPEQIVIEVEAVNKFRAMQSNFKYESVKYAEAFKAKTRFPGVNIFELLPY